MVTMSIVMLFKLFILITFSNIFPAVNGCGQIPAGQESTKNFNLTGFNLPAVMVYSDHPMARVKVQTISTTKSEAETYVQRLIMRSVEDVLYQQGRSALLPDNVISTILQQLDIQITYDPLKCDNVMTAITDPDVAMKINCLIVSDTAIRTCTNAVQQMCMNAQFTANSKPIDSKHFSISGSLKARNIIMANWTNQTWQNVLNRVLRSIISGPNGSYFIGASVRVT